MAGDDNVRQVRSIRDLAIGVIRSIENNYESLLTLDDGEEKISRKDVTNHLLVPGNVVCLAAAPGEGSTAFLLGVLMSLNLDQEGVLFYSPRDTGDDLFLRLLGYLSGRDSIRLAEGRMMESDWSPVIKWTEKLIDSRIQIHGSSLQEFNQVRAVIEAFQRDKGNLRLVILDDLIPVDSSDEAQEQRIEEMLLELKGIAIDYNVAILFTWKIQRSEAGSNAEDRNRTRQNLLHENYQKYLRTIMTLRKDDRRHRLSLYDVNTGKRFAMRLTLLTGIGVMTGP